MYQKQNMYGQQQSGQTQHFHLQEQDAANLVLSELKRAAREYTTAALESSHSAIRQTFVSLTQKTLQDQAELFTALSQIQGYGEVKMASQQEVQQELQQQIHKAEQLQSLVHHAVQSSYSSAAGMYQQQQVQQTQQPYGMQSQPYVQSAPYPSGYASESTGYGTSNAAISGSTTGYGSPSAATSGSMTGYGTSNASISGSTAGYVSPSAVTSSNATTGYAGASYAEQGYGQIGSPSYGPSVSTGVRYAGSISQDDDDSLKSSVSGTDQQEYFSARSVQDYNSNKFSSGSTLEAYGLKSQQDQTYTSPGHASTARQSGGYSFGGTSHSTGTSMGGSDSSAAGSSGNKQPSSQYSGSPAQSSKYMM